jgi:hypothetical protein
MGNFGGRPQAPSQLGSPVILVKRGALGSRMITPVRYLDFPPYVLDRLEDTRARGMSLRLAISPVCSRG